jgi:hypothetical protein
MVSVDAPMISPAFQKTMEHLRCLIRTPACRIPANCRGSPIPRTFASHSRKTPHLRHRSRLPENRRPRRLRRIRSQRVGRPRHQNLNQRSRCRHSAAGSLAENILDRNRRVLSFAPGSIFAFVRWTSSDFGTVLSRIDILRAPTPGQRYSTVPWITPGGESLLRLSGWPKVERALQLLIST